ncbi:MAG: VWA domain-containing protein [Ardenticatenaceae bacterium]|nr:VWA domain-containing protein [Ardenticatenaceae bacterium]
MSFLTPLFLLLGLLAVPIILLYMLRLRRREVLVSSTMLWQKLLRDREANAPWQKLRRNLLLILQLLILAALVLALARPFLPVSSVVSGSVVVLLDGSASMQATDVKPTRFETAKAEVGRLINDLSGSSQMTLIKVGQTPAILASATGDHTILRRALDTAQPEPAPADWAAAFALATGAAQGFQDARIILVSDGGLPDDLPPLPAESIYIPIGESGENLAITALATRDTDTGPQLFASVANEGLLDREALLSWTLDGTLFDSRRIVVSAGSNTNVTWELPAGTATIEARLSEHEGDNLPLDDTAWAVHEGGVSNRALLVTEGNLFLEQVYSVLPGVEAFKASPGNNLANDALGDGEFDLYVFDSMPLPSPLPAADMLIINPQPGEVAASGENDLLTVTGTFSNTVAIRLADSPLLQFVDWRNVHVRQAQVVSAPWAQRLVEAEGGPLIMIGERNGHRIAILTFDLRDSDLPLQIAFPILMANITSWLNPGRAFDAPMGLQPGVPVTIVPGASTTAVSVQKPDGTTWRADVGEDALIFNETDQLGLYTVNLQDNGGTRPAGSFAVNLFSPAESQIRPVETVRIGQTTVKTTSNGDVGQREFWPWLIGLAFVILLAEWWVHHRGTHLPKLNLR